MTEEQVKVGKCYAMPSGVNRRVVEVGENAGWKWVRIETLNGKRPGTRTREVCQAADACSARSSGRTPRLVISDDQTRLNSAALAELLADHLGSERCCASANAPVSPITNDRNICRASSSYDSADACGV